MKVERGGVKRQLRQNTLVYYASTRNRDNATPLETVRNVPKPTSVAGSNASNDLVRASAVDPLRASPPHQLQLLRLWVQMLLQAVLLSPLDARHGGLATCILISNTSEDGGAETTNDVQENVPDSVEDFDEDGESLPSKKKPRTNYDITRKFQLEWVCKPPWAEGILTNNGRLCMVKCTICSTMEKSYKLMHPKWDTLKKHEGRRKAIRNMPTYNVKKVEWYMAKDSKH